MLLGDIINIFIGLSLTFAMLALLVSTVVEGIASALKLRARGLLKGLGAILNDPNLNGLAADLLAHGAVNPRAPGGPDPSVNTAIRIMPSYISPLQFAGAFVDILENPPRRPGVQIDLATAIAGIADPQMRNLLNGIYRRVGGDLNRFHQELASWFDNSMEQLSGTYKRLTQLISFVIGLLLAGGLNIDAFHLVHQLWIHAAVVTVTPKAMPDPVEAANILQGLPFGWESGAVPANQTLCGALLMVAGWIFTAFAALFGAPFWFDTLQRFVQLRGTGTPPASQPQPPAPPIAIPAKPAQG